MKRADLLVQIAEAIEFEGELAPGMALDGVPTWDSLGILNVLDVYDTLGLKVELDRLQEAKTTDDLLVLAKDILDD